MTEVKLLAVLSADEEYMKRLSVEISKRAGERYKVVSFSDKDEALEFLNSGKCEVCVVDGRNGFNNLVSEFPGTAIILENPCDAECLCEDSDTYNKKVLSLFSPVSEILSEVDRESRCLRNETDTYEDRIVEQKINKQLCITGIFGFCETYMKNKYALSYARSIADLGKRVLYINLDEFNSDNDKLMSTSGADISDALYYFTENGGVFDNRINETIFERFGVDMIAPTHCVQDLTDMDASLFESFIKSIGKSEDYDCIILDVGSFIKEPSNLISLCDEVKLLYTHNSRYRISSFISYLHKIGSEYLEKTEQIEI